MGDENTQLTRKNKGGKFLEKLWCLAGGRG